jgi:cytochrome b561
MQVPVREQYSKLSIGLHWLMLALLIAVYACIELRELFPRESDIREGLKTWHFSLGLSVFLLVWARIAARFASPRRPALSGWMEYAGAFMHLALYILMIGMPVLGWLTLSAEGEPVRLFGLYLPPLVAANEAFAEQVGEIHQTAGVVGYWMIGLHASAALFHHYALKDGTLRRMIPARG